MMEFKTEEGRIWLPDAAGSMAAEVLFPAGSDGTVQITHTFVDDSLRGQGVAGRLMEAAAQKLRADGKKAKPVYSYAVAWFEKHPEYADVLA